MDNKVIASELLKIAKAISASGNYRCELHTSQGNGYATAYMFMSYSYDNSKRVLVNKDFKHFLDMEKTQPKTWQSIISSSLKLADNVKVYGYEVQVDTNNNTCNLSWSVDVKWTIKEDGDFDKCKQELMDFLTKKYSFRVFE